MVKLFQKTKLIGLGVLTILLISSCTSYNKTMREPNVRVELNKNDFSLSEQVKAEATSTRIIGIDFARIFKQKTGTITSGSGSISLSSIPVIGSFVVNPTANYALYELMQNNPGYDVVFYPQFETKIVKPIFGIGFISTTTKVTVHARLAKLK
jgi:hypothetical protein